VAGLRDPKAPLWLRRFATFELLDDRGEPARDAALAVFHQERTARLLPADLTSQGAPNGRRIGSYDYGFDEIATCRDERGTWWAAATSALLPHRERDARGEVWFLQSADGRRWTKPAFAFALGPDLGSVDSGRLHCAGGRLTLDLVGRAWLPPRYEERPVRRHLVFTIAQLYRDQDGDGLPDRLERQIGTDPRKPDTNGNGIPDGQDKNPLVAAHALTDEEGIYQAALEGLCQMGRSKPKNPSYSADDEAPYMLGSSLRPLLLPAPPGSPGVEILGHPGVVLCSPRVAIDEYAVEHGFASRGMFTAPVLAPGGVARERPRDRRRETAPAGDPLEPDTDVPRAKPLTFRDFFPYERSRDGTRARVGWRDEYQGIRPASDTFDVEVRKVSGRWYPVECRQVDAFWVEGPGTVIAPVRALHKGHK
jgi:hypothetical protein